MHRRERMVGGQNHRRHQITKRAAQISRTRIGGGIEQKESIGQTMVVPEGRSVRPWNSARKHMEYRWRSRTQYWDFCMRWRNGEFPRGYHIFAAYRIARKDCDIASGMGEGAPNPIFQAARYEADRAPRHNRPDVRQRDRGYIYC